MIGFKAVAVAEQFELDVIDIPVMLLSVGYATEGNWPKKPRKDVVHILKFV